MNKTNFKLYSPILTRFSISLVFLWFGISQLARPENFIGYLPSFLLSTDYARALVIFNGIFELIFGTLLIIGFYTRAVAFLLSLHLFSIAISLGYNDIAIRDLGLTLVTFSIFLGGADTWCLDYQRGKSD